MGYALCLMRAVDEAPCLTAEPIEPHGLDCAVPAVEVETEITAKAKPFIKAEATRINATTILEIKAVPGIEMGGASALARYRGKP